jgi:hypothetical protein
VPDDYELNDDQGDLMRPENGAQVSNIDRFYDIVGNVLGFLLERHPIPSTLPMLPIVGDEFRGNDHLHDIYYRTLDFLEDEGLIRAATPHSRGAECEGDNLPNPDLYGLTLKALSILALKPKELFPNEPADRTAGEVLIDIGKETISEAGSEGRKQVVAWLIGQIPRALGWF